MLRKWHVPTGSAYWAEDVADKHDNEIPTWDCMGTYVRTYTEGGKLRRIC